MDHNYTSRADYNHIVDLAVSIVLLNKSKMDEFYYWLSQHREVVLSTALPYLVDIKPFSSFSFL